MCDVLFFPKPFVPDRPDANAAALPTLDIAEGALDKLFGIYKQLLPHMGGYLTHAGQLHRDRLEMVLQQLANLELETLEQRAQVNGRACHYLYYQNLHQY